MQGLATRSAAKKRQEDPRHIYNSLEKKKHNSNIEIASQATPTTAANQDRIHSQNASSVKLEPVNSLDSRTPSARSNNNDSGLKSAFEPFQDDQNDSSVVDLEELLSMNKKPLLPENEKKKSMYATNNYVPPKELISKLDNKICNQITLITPFKVTLKDLLLDSSIYRYEGGRKTVFGDPDERIEKQCYYLYRTLFQAFEDLLKKPTNQLFLTYSNRTCINLFHHPTHKLVALISSRQENFERICSQQKIPFIKDSDNTDCELIGIRGKRAVKLFWNVHANILVKKDLIFQILSNYSFFGSALYLPRELFNGFQSRSNYTYLAQEYKNSKFCPPEPIIAETKNPEPSKQYTNNKLNTSYNSLNSSQSTNSIVSKMMSCLNLDRLKNKQPVYNLRLEGTLLKENFERIDSYLLEKCPKYELQYKVNQVTEHLYSMLKYMDEQAKEGKATSHTEMPQNRQ